MAYAKTEGSMAAMSSVRNAMMWAVPCFVMVTGALLLDKSRKLTYKKLFGRLILRMVISLIVFSVLFSVFDAVLISKNFGGGTILDGLKNALFGGGWKHMWYLYLMIALYLLMPAYRLVARSAEKKDILYLLGVYLVFLAILPNIQTLTGKDIGFYICVYSVYPLYLFLGYAMHNGMIKLNAAVSALMFVIGMGAVIGLTVYSTGRETKVGSLLGNYSFIPTVIMSAGAFGLLQTGSEREHKFIDRICTELEQCSFGIYLIHMAVLKLVFAVWKLDPFAHGGFITVLGISIAALAVSYVITKLLRYIPYVNKII